MKPIHKQPGRKPIRRKARTQQKEKEIRDRTSKILNRFQRKIVEMDCVLGQSIWTVHLKEFLEKKGVGLEWRLKLRLQCARITQQGLSEEIGGSRTEAISRKDEALVLRKIRRFFAAIEEAKEAGII